MVVVNFHIDLFKLNRKSYMQNKRKSWLIIAAFIFVFFSGSVWAIDNPDAPDLLGEFKVKEAPLLEAAENADNGYRDYLINYTNYLKFLDKELNIVYRSLYDKLPNDQQQKLKESQIAWLKYRDLEFSFVEETWTKSDFGSSSSISRGQYKASVVRNRVIQLIHYSVAY